MRMLTRWFEWLRAISPGKIMTIKTKKLVWAMVILLLAVGGCKPSSDTPNTPVSNADCGLGIAIADFGYSVVEPGDVLDFRANKISPNLDYIWSTVPAEFSENFFDPKDNKISFTVPDHEGTISIQMKVEGACTETAVPIIIDVASSEEPETAGATAAAEAEVAETTNTAVPTATPTPTTKPTNEPVVEETAVSSPIPAPTATATQSAAPTSPPAPTNTPRPEYNDPIITELEFLPGGAIYLTWNWDGHLSATQNFAVRFWSEADPRPEARFSITWTKDHSYQFAINNIEYPEGTYFINVAVMEGPSDGIHYALAESDNRSVFVEEIPPTDEPPVGP